MFVHAVYFWLNEGATDDDRRAFERGVKSLLAIETVEFGHVGLPAATDRPVIDRSYSYALVVAFRDEAAHDAYQVHPLHDRFREDCAKYWRKVQIYDSIDA